MTGTLETYVEEERLLYLDPSFKGIKDFKGFLFLVDTMNVTIFMFKGVNEV